MTAPRVPVEVLLHSGHAGHAVTGGQGNAMAGGGDAAGGLMADFAILEAGVAASRAWCCRQEAVVLGVSRDLDAEVDLEQCRRRGVAVLRRSSGGGTVAIGPGTLQWALVLPHASRPGVEPAGDDAEPLSIDAARDIANHAVLAALAATGIDETLESDPWGDLRCGDRKVGGLAIRRTRTATLVHGTLLAEADLAGIAALLKHPQREPGWRRGRPHADFLAGLGPIDVDAFGAALATAAPRAR